MQFCNHQNKYFDPADVWYPATDTPNNPTVRRPVSRMIGEPLTEVRALLSITKHSIQSLDSPHLQWIRPNVLPLTHTGRKGRRSKRVSSLCGQSQVYLKYTSVYLSKITDLKSYK